MLRRPGLSRAEAVIVVLIAALVVALILTAITNIRHAAARMGCQNNLKQLALGFHNYRDTYPDRLPPHTDSDLQSVFATLTPYLEARSAVYRPGSSTPDAYHAPSSVPFTYLSKDGTDGTQYGGDANQYWRTFLDPADTTADRLRDVPMTLPDGTTGYYATGSYAVNGLLPWGAKGADSSPNWLADTIIIAERPQVCRAGSGEVVYNLWGVGFFSPHMPAFAALTPANSPGLMSTAQVAPVYPLSDEGTLERDSRIPVRIGRADAIPQNPDFATPVQIVRARLSCDARLPGSPHRAGMQVAVGDGSVRLYGPDTTAWVFWSACAPPSRPDSTAGP